MRPARVKQCDGIPLVGRLTTTHRGLLVVSVGFSASAIHDAQVELRVSTPLVGYLLIPHCRLRTVFWHVMAPFVNAAHIALRDSTPLRCLAFPSTNHLVYRAAVGGR